MTDAIARFLTPASVAVVGASRSVGVPSQFLVQALREYGHPAEVHLVNPGGYVIDGQQSVRSVQELPDGLDLALVMVPAAAVVEVVETCAAKGFGGAIVFSAGFADDRDAKGAAREAQLAELVARTGIRVLGPNSQGFLNLTDGIVTSFSPAILHNAMHTSLGNDDVTRARGNVAVLAQSGGLGFSLLSRGLARGIRFSQVISMGNEVDLELQDFLEHLIDDPATDVVLMYVEGLKAPERFQALAAKAQQRGTRLVVAKVGASPAAQRAALSHTGHIAGDDGAYRAVFRRHGVESVRDPDEMLDIALALSQCRPARGRRVAVVSASGGSAVWLADALSAAGLDLPPLGEAAAARVQDMLPSFASTANPIDISGGASMGPADVLGAIADDPGIDALVLATTLARPQRIIDDRPVLTALAARTDKPTVVYTYTEPSQLACDVLRELRLPLYSGIASCANGLAAVVRAGESCAEPDHPLPPSALHDARGLVAACDADVLCEYEAKAALAALGVAVPPEVLAATAAHAVNAAEQLGYPVALKLQSPDVPHKAAAGGVVLGCRSAADVEHAFAQIVAAVQADVPHARVHGVLVQPMAPPGFELLVGVQNRSGLGPIVVLGIGGELVEILNRTVAYPAPFGPATARRLLTELGVHRVVDDLAPLADVVSRVSAFAAGAADLVAELDLNPVIVERRSGRVHVVDALLARPTPPAPRTGE
jgi:acyl-CoA synthetase (NDP forming)